MRVQVRILQKSTCSVSRKEKNIKWSGLRPVAKPIKQIFRVKLCYASFELSDWFENFAKPIQAT